MCNKHSSPPSACSTARALIISSASYPYAVKRKAIVRSGAEEQESEELWWKWLGVPALVLLPGDASLGFTVRLSQEFPGAPAITHLLLRGCLSEGWVV